MKTFENEKGSKVRDIICEQPFFTTSHVTEFFYLQNVKLHLISSKALNFQLTEISRSFKTPAWFS